MSVANWTAIGVTSQAFFQAATTSTLQISTTSSPQMEEEANECVNMNNLLWDFRQDLTTRPPIMGLFAMFYSIIIFLGVVGNICVILAISRTRSLQTVPNMFIFSLSCSDVVVCCTSATITPITAFQKEWLFGRFLCSVAPFIAGVSLCFSTFTLAAISLDRFMLIRFPMKKPFSHVQAFFVICLICILAMAMSVPVMFMQTLKPLDKYCGQFCYEDWGANANQRRAYGTLMLTLQFIIPLIVIVFCYTAISLRLGQSVILKSKKKQQGGYEWQLQMSDQQRAATKRRQRTNRMFIAMVVAFSLSWIWTLMFNLLRDYEILPQFVKDQEFFFGILTHCIAMTSTVWNPFVYAFLNLQLRAAFWQLMPKCLKQCLADYLSDKKSEANKNGGPAQDMHLKNGQGVNKRRRSSPVNPTRRASHVANGLLSTGDVRTGRSDYEDETTATIAGLVESPMSTATSALLEYPATQNSPNAKYGSFAVVPVPPTGYRPAIPSFGIGVVREELIKAQSLHTSSISQSAVSADQPPQAVFNNHLEPDPNVSTQQPCLSCQWSVGGDAAYCNPLQLQSSANPQKTFVKELLNSWSDACDQRERKLGGQLSEPLLPTPAQLPVKHRRGAWSRTLTLNINHPATMEKCLSSTFRGSQQCNSPTTHSAFQQQYGQNVCQPRLGRRKSDWQNSDYLPVKNGLSQEEVFNESPNIVANCEDGELQPSTELQDYSFSADHPSHQFQQHVGGDKWKCGVYGLRALQQICTAPNSPRSLKNIKKINKSSDSLEYQ